jgi:hypothetical protein
LFIRPLGGEHELDKESSVRLSYNCRKTGVKELIFANEINTRSQPCYDCQDSFPSNSSIFPR